MTTKIPTADESRPRMVGTVVGGSDAVEVWREVFRDDDGTIVRNVRIVSECGELVLNLDPDDADLFAALVTRAARMVGA